MPVQRLLQFCYSSVAKAADFFRRPSVIYSASSVPSSSSSSRSPSDTASTITITAVRTIYSYAPNDFKNTAFTCFPKLPPELRNRIWRLASNQPQIIPVRHTTFVPIVQVHGHGTQIYHEYFSTDMKPSALLSVSKEARSNFLAKFPDTIETVEEGRIIRFNAADDTILLWSKDCGINIHDLLCDLTKPEPRDLAALRALQSIQSLALANNSAIDNEYLWGNDDDGELPMMMQLLSYFPGLKTLVLVEYGKINLEDWDEDENGEPRQVSGRLEFMLSSESQKGSPALKLFKGVQESIEMHQLLVPGLVLDLEFQHVSLMLDGIHRRYSRQ